MSLLPLFPLRVPAPVAPAIRHERAHDHPARIEAQILRLHHVEKWPRGTIAPQLHVHHGTVTRVLAQAGLPRTDAPRRPSKIDPYLPLILETLQKYPRLTASRLFAMVCERGYKGSPDHFRHLIACVRPRPPAEAYLRLRTFPAEQGQTDWGAFEGHSPPSERWLPKTNPT
jgi:hypothetical protein